MATVSGATGRAGAGEPGYRIVRVDAARQFEAVGRLIRASPRDEGAVRAFMEQAAADGTPLDWMWATEGLLDNDLRLVCLGVPNPGRTLGLFVSAGPGKSLATRGERAKLLMAVCEAAAGDPVLRHHLPQALLEPEQSDAVAAYLAAGFVRLADLAYMRRVITHGGRREAVAWPAGVEVVSLADLPYEEGERGLREALEGSYVDTLDCPALCGMRAVEDVVVSHRSVGEYDPGFWWLVRAKGGVGSGGGRYVGCMLINPGVSEDTAELVYLGLSPEARGKGLARGLLTMGLSKLGHGRESVLACAVDLQNRPALKLYEGLGFRRFALRIAVVKPLGGSMGR